MRHLRCFCQAAGECDTIPPPRYFADFVALAALRRCSSTLYPEPIFVFVEEWICFAPQHFYREVLAAFLSQPHGMQRGAGAYVFVPGKISVALALVKACIDVHRHPGGIGAAFGGGKASAGAFKSCTNMLATWKCADAASPQAALRGMGACRSLFVWMWRVGGERPAYGSVACARAVVSSAACVLSQGLAPDGHGLCPISSYLSACFLRAMSTASLNRSRGRAPRSTILLTRK